MKRLLAPLALGLLSRPAAALADAATSNDPVFNGGGLEGGIETIESNFSSLFTGSLQEVILRIIRTILDLIGIVAVGVVIAAGVLLIISGGSEDSKNRAKTMITYALIGLVIIILSRLLVTFVLTLVTDTI